MSQCWWPHSHPHISPVQVFDCYFQHYFHPCNCLVMSSFLLSSYVDFHLNYVVASCLWERWGLALCDPVLLWVCQSTQLAARVILVFFCFLCYFGLVAHVPVFVYISFTLCDAVGGDDFCMLHIYEASAWVVSVHLGDLGIGSTSLCRSLSWRYLTSLQFSFWRCSPARIGVDPSFMLSFQQCSMSSACMMSSACICMNSNWQSESKSVCPATTMPATWLRQLSSGQFSDISSFF